jgi:hypothetical protein
MMKRRDERWPVVKEVYQVLIRQVTVYKPASRSSNSRLEPAKKEPQSEDSQTHASPQQRRNQTGERLANLMAWGFVITCIALTVKALLMAKSSAELLDIIERVWPYLIALLTPILQYYFSRRRGRNRDDEET